MPADYASFDAALRLAIYDHIVAAAAPPSVADMARRMDAADADILAAYARLARARLIVLDATGAGIRMAMPFSGVETPHVAHAGGRRYFANCGWDLLGVFAALHAPGRLESRCGESGDPLLLDVGPDGPPECDWVFHTPLPAARWWDNVVDT